MVVYYFYNLLMYVVSRFGLRFFLVVLLLSYPFFLYLLPETGYDFAYYQQAYENIFFDPSASLFFRSGSTLTAEPGWFLYNGLVSFITGDFRTFLVINLVLTTLLMIVAFRKYGIPDKYVSQIVALMIPIQFITIFFWSPRSALPLAFTFLFVAFLRKGNFVIAVIFAMMAILIHSQYGLIIIFCGFYYSAMFLIKRDRSKMTQVSLPVMLGISGATVSVALMITILLPFLSFIPSFDIISSKTSYITSESEGFRATAIISILIFPGLLLWRWKEISARQEFDVVVIFVAFSLIVNIVFFDKIHIAGRLGRASDYFLFGYFVIEASRAFFGRASAFPVIVLLIVFPFLFQDLYPVSEFF